MLSPMDPVRVFCERFGRHPKSTVCASGRVNLIGEHTDYNDGFVLPMAIPQTFNIGFCPRADDRVVVYSLDYCEEQSFTVSDLTYGAHGWIEHVKAVAWALRQRGFKVSGWEGVTWGDVPRGAGLSSSAALEVATVRAFMELADCPLDPTTVAKVCQEAEAFVGVNCGIMDPLIVALAKPGEAFLIDCRDLTARPVAVTTDIVILDTNTRRRLNESAYNNRRAECAAAAEAMRLTSLRELRPEILQREGPLAPTLWRRARHVLTENTRTLRFAECMATGDLAAAGRLLTDSHTSLRDDFEVVTPALDAMVQCALRQEAVLGARMTGAGFGGCVVALLAKDIAFSEDDVLADYRRQTGLEGVAYPMRQK